MRVVQGFFAQDVREAKGWGVLGRRNLRMRFRDLNCEWFSSQGMPVQELQESASRRSHGWPAQDAKRLGERWKRPVFRNSSTQFFRSTRVALLLLVVASVMWAEVSKAKPEHSQVAENFEALMLSHLYSQIENSGRWVDVGDENPFAPTQAQRIFEGFRNQEMLKVLAARRPLGVADMVQRQLSGQNGIDKSRIQTPTLIESQSQAVQGRGLRDLEIQTTEGTSDGYHKSSQ